MQEQRGNVFSAEQSILQGAYAELASGSSGGDGEWMSKYRELTVDYEKLLKMAMKISRISDIQGRMLKEKEQEIQVANDSLWQLEQSRRVLIQDISHELRTPMTTVQGYVEALLDGVVTADEKYLRMIHNRLLMLNRLLTDLFHLDTLKTNQMEFQAEDLLLDEWVEDLAGKYAADAAGKGVRLTARGMPAAPCGLRARFDPIRIEQVLSNMIHNALRFSPPGGELRIAWERLDRDQLLQRFDGCFAGGTDPVELPAGVVRAAVLVIDQGPGVRQEDVPLLFERFYRGAHPKQAGENGSGLGLAIAREIVRRHGGEIGAYRNPEGGSTFFFTLPVTSALASDRFTTQKEEIPR